MQNIIRKYYQFYLLKVQEWSKLKYSQLFVFNVIVIMLVLLRSAGYFDPFFSITINFIAFTGLVLAVILLDARSKLLFLVALVFWILAAVLRLAAIEVWAE